RIRTEFPRQIIVEDHWIPTRDGTCLHARIWRPADADVEPVPALLEYLPYRKDDWTAVRDAQRHPWYAGHGYASARVDLRGSGSSEGVMVDEYTEVELADGVDVVHWLAEQPWCTGAVGMFGISWGGFNSLQIAALRPEPLKAIVTVCSTDDRYDNDVHYIGGAVLGIDMPAWAGTMQAFTARPPDPAVVGEQWREMWRERLEAAQPFLSTWLSHQERDAYWRHGSVCEDYSSVRAAVLAVGGWADPYRDTVLRLVDNLPGPVRGILGPWAHRYPDIELPPGPAIGFLQETLRWWDHWLKGEDTGVLDEPLLRAYLQDGVAPATAYPRREGRWVGVDVSLQAPPGEPPSGPSPESPITWRRTGLDEMRSASFTDADGHVVVRTPQHTGVDAGRFFPFGNPSDLPPDQRAEDGRSVCFDTPPLTEPLPVLGQAAVTLRMACDVPRANVVVRLCDVAPDGSSTLVSRGVLNLMTRHGRDRAVPWTPGDIEDVRVGLTAAGYTLPAGHRLRLAVSTTYWPWVWPHGDTATLRLDPAGSALTVPLWDGAVGLETAGRETSGAGIAFDEPEQAPPLEHRAGAGADGPERQVTHVVDTGEWILSVDPNYGGTRIFPDGLHYTEKARETYRICADDPLAARASSEWRIALSRGEWTASLHTSSEMTATYDEFVVETLLEASDADGVVAKRTWRHRIPRTSG
ncbi:CocE/NonD family hydrolase, partial [Phytoactinopolyspora endophytica]|uniref:CocE/NonD family hydrolase n=1 Tax=Phytoactinopolyspora endophytica TaxID=1642495 RepID=UPI00197B395E